LDHVIVLNERHLRTLLKEYVRYYHEDRTHLGLGKDTCASPKPCTSAESMTWKCTYAARLSLSFLDVCARSTSARLGRLGLSLPRRTSSGEPGASTATAGCASPKLCRSA